MACSTRSDISGDTPEARLITRETLILETPARAATSAMVGRSSPPARAGISPRPPASAAADHGRSDPDPEAPAPTGRLARRSGGGRGPSPGPGEDARPGGRPGWQAGAPPGPSGA